MRFPKPLHPRLLLLLAGLGATSWSRTSQADEKQVCLAAADSGQSLRDDGQYLIARDQFVTCARDVCPKVVHDQCVAWLHQLDETTPTVVFSAKDDRGNEVTTARVISDGKLITSTLDGKPVQLDPGAHDVRFERDPSGATTVHVVLKPGEKNHEVAATFPAQEGELPPAATEPPEAAARAGGEAETTLWNARNVTSLSLVAAGAVAVGVGVYFGLHSQSENNKGGTITDGLMNIGPNGTQVVGGANKTNGCHDFPTQSGCSSLNAARDAQDRDAVLSDVFYIAGGVLAAAGAATWLLWPKKEPEAPASTAWLAPTLGPGNAGMVVHGKF